MKNRKAIYFNQKQLEFLQAKQKFRAGIWGRGTGKSTVMGAINVMRLKAIPRGKVFFSSTTYNQILTKTMAAVEVKWEDMGLMSKDKVAKDEPYHYVVGTKPPPGFMRPYNPPRRYENVVTFWNGFTIEFLSMDRPDLARGGSYDGGDVDEWALVPGDHFKKVLLPSVRGNRERFTSPLHGLITGYSSMPWKPSGYYILDYQEKARLHPNDYFYSEATAYDNIEVLGEDYIKRMEEELGYLEFQVEILNRRFVKAEKGFYHKFDVEKHGYKPKYDYDYGERGIISKGAADVRANELLDVSFDFSGWFNCCSVWQERDDTEYCVRQFYSKQEGIDTVVDKFCDHFKDHKYKFVRIWGEPRGHDKSPLGGTIFDHVAAKFRERGWAAEVRASAGRTTDHIERHDTINQVFDETSHLPKVRINEESCKDIIIALQIAEVSRDFQKVKTVEKDRNYPQEHAPHFTDTLDYYLIQKHGWKIGGGFLLGPRSVKFG